MDGSNDQDQGPTGAVVSERLAYYLKVLRRRWRVVALVPAVAVAVSLAIGLQAQKEYDATAKLVVNPRNQITALLNPSAAAPSADPERDLNTEVSRIKTVPIAEAVRRKLGLQENPETLLSQVTTSLDGTTNIVDVKVRDPGPAEAARLANAFATRYVAARERDARSAFERAAARARAQLQSLTPAQLDLAQGNDLRSRLRELEVGSTLQTGNAEIIQPATKPATPATPRVLFDTVLAAFLGLVLGVVAAGILELLDRRVKDEDDVRLITRLPSLGGIPGRRRATRSQRLESDPEQTEAYRSLATNLRFFKLGSKFKTLLITSPSPLDGKTSVTLSLARALAEHGQKVIAIECDLRRPRFADYLGRSQTHGLSSILAGMTRWSQEVIEVDADGRTGSRARSASLRFSVLPSGPAPPNPHALLSSTEMYELLVELCISNDVVLLDAPPLGMLTDAVPLLPWVDCVALVVRLQHTTRDALKKSCNMLAELDGGAPVLGTVLTGVPRSPLSGYYGAEGPSPPAASLQHESQDGRAGGRRAEGAPTSQA